MSSYQTILNIYELFAGVFINRLTNTTDENQLREQVLKVASQKQIKYATFFNS